MSLSAIELARIVAELSAVLPGAAVDKVQEPSPNCCQLKLRKHLLWIDLRPGLTRLHLVDAKRKAPPKPSGWVMKLRKELLGMRLLKLEQLNGDRIVRLSFIHGHKPARSLLLELFGRTSRMLLLDEDDRMLIAAKGEAPPGQPYEAPGPASVPDRSPRFPEADSNSLACNHAVASFYGQAEASRTIEDLRRRLASELRAKHKKVARRVNKMEADRNRTLVAEDLRSQAEALKLHLGMIRRGQTRLSLSDPADPEGEEIVVELNPALSPVDNMNRMFSRARRLSAARGGIVERLEKGRKELNDMEALQRRLAEAESLAQLEAVGDDLGLDRPKLVGPRTRRQARRLPFHSYISAKGKRILVGRSGKDNHELTFHIARGSDLWLHARDAAGAHVIVRLGRGQEVDHETLLDAASLAASNSPFKNDDKVDVSYTHVKNVRPIKGAAPGLVSVGRAKNILVRMEASRIERLESTKNS